MKALVFGANGQDGPYLIEALREHGIETVGISRSGPWRRGDVARRADVEEAVRELRPDFVFQLAASSTTRHDVLFENHETICTGALNVLESVRLHCPEARVFIPGSGLQFENRGTPSTRRHRSRLRAPTPSHGSSLFMPRATIVPSACALSSATFFTTIAPGAAPSTSA